MNLLSDVLTYIRRIIKSPSNAQITDNLLIDYVNRFWIMDVDARLQLFDLKTKYQFQTQPSVDRYNMPLYDVQVEGANPAQSINFYPVYQGFVSPAYINGIQVPLQTQKNSFFNIWPNIVQNLQVVGVGNGSAGPYTLQLPMLPQSIPPNPPINGIIRGHVDITGVIATGNNVDPPLVSAAQILANDNFIQQIPVTSVDSSFFLLATDITGANVVVADSGQFLEDNVNYGLLMNPGKAPNGNLPLGPLSTPGNPNYSTTLNTINYITGEVTVNFPAAIPAGVNITAQCFYFQSGLPRSILFYNNVLTLRSPPDRQYLVELDAYLSPAAYLNSDSAIQFAYMSEYLARGAARKILSDTGDVEQFQFYEPLFKEQELLVWKRSQRIWTNNRTETLYSQGFANGAQAFNGLGSGSI